MAWQFASGEILTNTNLNAVTKPWNAICQMKRSAPLSITNSTTTVVNWTSTDLDPLNWNDAAGATPSRMIPTIAGWYRVTYSTDWQSDTDYTRILVTITKNGSSTVPFMGVEMRPATITHTPRVSGSFPLVSMNGTTDYLELTVSQTNTSAGSMTVDPAMLVELMYPV